LGQPDGGYKSWQSPKLPSYCYGGPGTVEEGGIEEEKGIRGMNHTFASSSRPSASHPFVILSSWVVKQKLARNNCNVEYFCAKGNTHQYWPFPVRIFSSKGGFFPERRCSCASDVCNPGACSQRSISTIG
jgi:hypothetical protein